MAKNTQTPVVAELGRPETPEETAARKAESSRLHRVRQTFRNLIASLLVCGVVVLVIVFIVPRDDTPIELDVDYAAAASEAQHGISEQLIAPTLPETWTSNEAEIRTGADGVTEWYIGLILADTDGNAGEYVGFSQGVDANPTWLVDKVATRAQTGTVTIGGITWDEYDYTDLPPDEAGNTAYTLVHDHDGSTFVIYGSHTAEAVQTVAAAVADEL
ncbi:MAG: DUF4245 family protein [Pseudoclavibacter sp.]